MPGVGWRPGADRRPHTARKRRARPDARDNKKGGATEECDPEQRPAGEAAPVKHAAVPGRAAADRGSRREQTPGGAGARRRRREGRGAPRVLRGIGWATGHVQKVTRDGAVDVTPVCRTLLLDDHAVRRRGARRPARARLGADACLASKNGVVGCRGL